jgi:hypothetical protein
MYLHIERRPCQSLRWANFSSDNDLESPLLSACCARTLLRTRPRNCNRTRRDPALSSACLLLYVVVPVTFSISSGRKTASLGLLAVLAFVFAVSARPSGQAATEDDAIAKLGRKLEAGSATLEYREQTGYLPSLLQLLGIRIDSQVLVFSKTSFQHALISPKNPRAVYFNDNVAIGMVPGGTVYEMVALEPSHGLAFYTLDTRRTDRPSFQRRGVECLFCHAPGNKGAGALVVASVIPLPDGSPAYTSAFIDTIDHRTPFSRRWGGWYVTGTHGSQTHMGNAVVSDPEHALDLDVRGAQNVTSLAGRFDVHKYLAPTSDIVALMTLEHQVGAVNRLGALGVQYRNAERAGVMSKADEARIDGEVRDLVDYLVFKDEAVLEAPVQGVSPFTQTFAASGPRDSHGRSLREFDLQTRLFKYRLSYMIYSDLFDAMPAALKSRVYKRLTDVLDTRDPVALAIARETKPDFKS